MGSELNVLSSVVNKCVMPDMDKHRPRRSHEATESERKRHRSSSSNSSSGERTTKTKNEKIKKLEAELKCQSDSRSRSRNSNVRHGDELLIPVYNPENDDLMVGKWVEQVDGLAENLVGTDMRYHD